MSTYPKLFMALAFVTFVVGCGDDHEIAVDVLTEFVPGAEFDSILLTLPGEAPMRFPASEGVDYAMGARLADLVRSEGDFLMTGALTLDGRVVVEKRHQVTLQTDIGVTFLFQRSCQRVTCGEDEVCLSGACTDNRCTPETPMFCPPPECTSATTCPESLCGGRACVSGACLRSDDGSCGEGLYCSPDIGCLPRPGENRMDAGTDAQVPDTGNDAGPDAGCEPETGAELCASRGRVCGRATATDRCGDVRDLDCGECDAGNRCAGATCEPCLAAPCRSGHYTDFEGAVPGSSVTGFEGWRASECAPYDQELVDDGTGNIALRFSNAVATSCINSIVSDCPAGNEGITPSTWETNPDLFAGEPSLSVTYNRFVHEMRFRSATGAAQMNLWMELSADDGHGRRQSRMVINDVGTGLRIIDLAGRIHFDGLSYDEWHTIRIEIAFADGPMNDTVAITVDGVPSALRPFIGTLETYYRTEEPDAGITAVQCTLLHPGIAVNQAPALAGGGLFIDDVATWLERGP
ncbi:MAG: hypothetical protein AB8H86_17145 [Polyangiales bacterium]